MADTPIMQPLHLMLRGNNGGEWGEKDQDIFCLVLYSRHNREVASMKPHQYRGLNKTCIRTALVDITIWMGGYFIRTHT